LDSGKPVKNQRPVALADTSDLRWLEPLPVVEVEDLDEGRFSQPLVGVEGGEQLEDLRGDAALCLIRLRGLSGWSRLRGCDPRGCEGGAFGAIDDALAGECDGLKREGDGPGSGHG
jgi:hypothetical protein